MMKHLFTAWSEISPQISSRNHFVFLDYDGTLTPIVSTPEEAVLSSRARHVIEQLGACKGIRVAIITGRALIDIRQRVGIDALMYAGNHGLEAAGPGFNFLHAEADQCKEVIAQINRQLENAFSAFSEVRIEHKVFSLSVHIRQVPPSQRVEVERIFNEMVELGQKQGAYTIRSGKEVWEIRPPIQWHKGSVVSWLLKQVTSSTFDSPLVWYFGDDRTDEDAFETIGHKGITVKVVSREGESSKADYYLESSEEVLRCLERIRDVRR